MIRRMLLQIVILGVTFSLATALFGWLAVPILGFFWGCYERTEARPAFVASIAAGVGWLLLLVWTGTSGPVLAAGVRNAGVLGVPTAAFAGLTLMFPMALAWGAAVVAETSRHYWSRATARNE